MATRNRPWSSLLSSNGSSLPSRVTEMSSGSRRACGVVVVDAVPEPEDAVLAVDREVDGDRLGDVEVAVLVEVEVRDVRRDRGVLVVGVGSPSPKNNAGIEQEGDHDATPIV